MRDLYRSRERPNINLVEIAINAYPKSILAAEVATVILLTLAPLFALLSGVAVRSA